MNSNSIEKTCSRRVRSGVGLDEKRIHPARLSVGLLQHHSLQVASPTRGPVLTHRETAGKTTANTRRDTHKLRRVVISLTVANFPSRSPPRAHSHHFSYDGPELARLQETFARFLVRIYPISPPSRFRATKTGLRYRSHAFCGRNTDHVCMFHHEEKVDKNSAKDSVGIRTCLCSGRFHGSFNSSLL